MPYCLEKVLFFRGTYGFHLHDRRVSQERNQQNLSLPTASAGFLLGILSNPEDEGSIILRNIGLSLDYVAFQPMIQYTSVVTKVMVLWLPSFPLFGRAQMLTWEPVS
jgi:hypothetical protein